MVQLYWLDPPARNLKGAYRDRDAFCGRDAARVSWLTLMTLAVVCALAAAAAARVGVLEYWCEWSIIGTTGSITGGGFSCRNGQAAVRRWRERPEEDDGEECSPPSPPTSVIIDHWCEYRIIGSAPSTADAGFSCRNRKTAARSTRPG
jgi:hypothetical protein